MELPRALYRAESDVLINLPPIVVFGMSVHPSGNPWSRSASKGVNRLTA